MTTTHIGHDIDQAAYWLRQGACVGIPTETVYGLAANALDPAAVVQIFEIKNRPAFDPLIVHVGGIAEVEKFAREFPPALRQLAEAFWPGPLTLLLPKRAVIPDLVSSGLPRVALRAPAQPLVRALLRELPFPLAAPSANPFGYISPTTAQHVFDQLQGKIPYILDGGPCAIGLESTIVGYDAGAPAVYRLGGLSVEAIEAVVGPVRLEVQQSSNPAAPGMLKSHYAPRKPVLLGRPELTDAAGNWLFTAQLAGLPAGRIGVLTFRPQPDLPAHGLQIALSEQGSLPEAAQNLFAALRRLDQAEVTVILAEILPEEGLGRAINDRLRRAAVREDDGQKMAVK